tara:strand:+ start:655 stop:1011 length:357 start_codon:yes stop_codon:yes gene_type:complete
MASLRESSLEDIADRLQSAFGSADVSVEGGENRMDNIIVSNLDLELDEIRIKVLDILENGSFVALRSIWRDSRGSDLWNLDSMLSNNDTESLTNAIITITYIQLVSKLQISFQWSGKP